jgi:hypothetical protein
MGWGKGERCELCNIQILAENIYFLFFLYNATDSTDSQLCSFFVCTNYIGNVLKCTVTKISVVSFLKKLAIIM